MVPRDKKDIMSGKNSHTLTCKNLKQIGKAWILHLLLILVVFGPGLANGATATYRDKLGRVVTISIPVKRAVFLISYELIPVMDIWDDVVGLGRWAYEDDVMRATKPDLKASIPSVGSGSDVNMEALLRLRPDLVITWTFKPELVKFMEERGLKVVAIYPESINELYEVMRFHGKVFQRETRIEYTIAEMERYFGLIRERVSGIPEAQKRKVLYLGGKPTSVSAKLGVTNDIIELIGGRNPAATIAQRNADVPIERILAWNPDVIVIWGNAKYTVSDLIESDHWRVLEAVRKRRVYKSPEWSTWSPRLAPYALWMAAMAYPKRFTDINLDRMVKRFQKNVFGISYKDL